MNKDRILASLCAEARRIRETVCDTVWYVFGSASREVEGARDVDVLVLCHSNDAVVLVRDALRDVCMRLPLHLFLITRDEEDELQFIGAEGCVQLMRAGECE